VPPLSTTIKERVERQDDLEYLKQKKEQMRDQAWGGKQTEGRGKALRSPKVKEER